jgi:hypothetical protein
MDSKGVTPRFEFGFGLSYTTFGYSSLSTSASGSSQVVSFTVKNTGSIAGTEIAQLYLTYPSSAGEPKKVLRGFEEVDLGVGESKTVTITLSAREMRCVLCAFPRRYDIDIFGLVYGILPVRSGFVLLELSLYLWGHRSRIYD